MATSVQMKRAVLGVKPVKILFDDHLMSGSEAGRANRSTEPACWAIQGKAARIRQKSYLIVI